LGVSIVIMSVIIVAFAAITLTFIYDKYHPSDESVWQNSSANIPGVRTTSAGTSHAGTSRAAASAAKSSVSGRNVSSGTNKTTITPLSCTNECASSGTKKCVESSSLSCGNFDTDSCLEWGGDVDCANGCLNGECKTGAVIAGIGCTESNSAHNVSINGIVTDKYGNSYPDFCYNSTTLKQYRCTTNNLSSFSLIYCPHDCSADGYCFPNAPIIDQGQCNNDNNCLAGSTGASYCENNNVCADSVRNNCVNAGTAQSYCNATTIKTCNACASERVCSNGVCTFSGCGDGQKLVTTCAVSYWESVVCSGNLIKSGSFSDYHDCQTYCGSVGAGCFRDGGSPPICECYSGSVGFGGLGWGGGDCISAHCISNDSNALVQPSSSCGTNQRLVTSCATSIGQNAACSGDLVNSTSFSSAFDCRTYCGGVGAGCYTSTGSSSPSCNCYSGSIYVVTGIVANGYSGGNCAGGQCVSNGVNIVAGCSISSDCASGMICSSGHCVIDTVHNCKNTVGDYAACSGNFVSQNTIYNLSDCARYCGSVGATCYVQTGQYTPNCQCYNGSIINGGMSKIGWAGGNCLGIPIATSPICLTCPSGQACNSNGQCVSCNECSPEYLTQQVDEYGPRYNKCMRNATGCLKWVPRCSYGVLQSDGSCLESAQSTCSVDSDCGLRFSNCLCDNICVLNSDPSPSSDCQRACNQFVSTVQSCKCLNGACVDSNTPACYSDSDCHLGGSNVITTSCDSGRLCTSRHNGNVCTNPGTIGSSCTNIVTSCSDCPAGQSCSNGACV